jgi:hypothetical protein
MLRVIFALTLALLAVGAGCASELRDNTPTEPNSTLPNIYEGFAALSDVSRIVPSSLLRQVQRSLRMRYRERLIPLSARRIDFGAMGDVWIVGSQRFVCALRASDGAFACQPRRSFRQHGIVLGVFRAKPGVSRPPRDFTLLALVPDGIRKAILSVGGFRIVLPVHENRYALSADAPIRVADYQE